MIDRANHARWDDEGQPHARRPRAGREVARLVTAYTPSRLGDDVKAELTRRMAAEAKRHGMDRLPAQTA